MNANCRYAQDNLSAFIDDELPRNQSASIEQHLAECSSCQDHYTYARHISRLISTSLSAEDTSARPWETLERRLVEHSVPTGAALPTPASLNRSLGRWSRSVHPPRLAFAAAFLFVLGIVGWYALPHLATPATDLTPFAAQFIRDPDRAQASLASRYSAIPMDPRDGARAIGWRFGLESAKQPPFQLASIQTLRMPCCNCIEAICQRPDGSKIAVFGHRCHAQVKVGDGAEQKMHCDGKTCRLVELGASRYALKWQAGDLQLVMVGARSESEIEQLVAWLNPE